MVARGKDGDEIVRGWDGHVYTAIVKIKPKFLIWSVSV